MNPVATSDIAASGRFVHVGTHKLYIVLSGCRSDHTIVLESGGGKDSTGLWRRCPEEMVVNSEGRSA